MSQVFDNHIWGITANNVCMQQMYQYQHFWLPNIITAIGQALVYLSILDLCFINYHDLLIYIVFWLRLCRFEGYEIFEDTNKILIKNTNVGTGGPCVWQGSKG